VDPLISSNRHIIPNSQQTLAFWCSLVIHVCTQQQKKNQQISQHPTHVSHSIISLCGNHKPNKENTKQKQTTPTSMQHNEWSITNEQEKVFFTGTGTDLIDCTRALDNIFYRPYHLEQEAALVNLLVPGELLRHGVADASEAPRGDHLRRPTKLPQLQNSTLPKQ
jgi:hypothetical protein